MGWEQLPTPARRVGIEDYDGEGERYCLLPTTMKGLVIQKEGEDVRKDNTFQAH
jgi:hypothetical protein